MKQLFILLLSVITLTVTAQDTNKVPVVVSKGQVFNLDTKKTPKTKEQLAENATLTTNTAILKGNTYPVYAANKSGKFFIIIQSEKTKNWYRKYICSHCK